MSGTYNCVRNNWLQMKRSGVEFHHQMSNRFDPTKKKSDERLRHSNWFITINPNVALKTTEQCLKAMDKGIIPHRRCQDEGDIEAIRQDFADKFESVLNRLFGTNNIPNIVKFRKNGQAFNSIFVQKVSAQTAVEYGEKFGKIHSHTMLNVAHRSCVILDYPLLVQSVNEGLGIETTRVYNKLYRNANDNLVDYLDKQQRSDLK